MKTLEAVVNLNTWSGTEHLGRYTVQVFDTTNGQKRPMRLKHTNDPAGYVTELTTMGLAHGVMVEMIDETGR